MTFERSKPKTYEQMKAVQKATKEEILETDHVVTAVENGPGSTSRQFGRTLEGIRLETIISIYSELIGQTARQSRNVEQMAPEIAVRSIKCADELIRALTANRPAA